MTIYLDNSIDTVYLHNDKVIYGNLIDSIEDNPSAELLSYANLLNLSEITHMVENIQIHTDKIIFDIRTLNTIRGRFLCDILLLHDITLIPSVMTDNKNYIYAINLHWPTLLEKRKLKLIEILYK